VDFQPQLWLRVVIRTQPGGECGGCAKTLDALGVWNDWRHAFLVYQRVPSPQVPSFDADG
jgi:hypothetical protein